MARIIIVSNRLPVTVKRGKDAVEVVRSAGGLATGLCGPHQQSGGKWIGWPGDTAGLSPPQLAQIDEQLAAQRLVPVHLSAAEVEGYYEGFSNRVLWPLFHYLIDHIPLQTFEWDLYRKVNERFADAVAAQLEPGDLVWVHDYQLCLVPALLRERVPDARIGFFLHIPFPDADVLQALPWRNALLRGLLGADLIGFHTHRYLHHFADAAARILGTRTELDRVAYDGRAVRLGTYPMGIDAKAFDEDARRPEVMAEARRIREESRGAKILLGIDRLDYTKGIRRRLLALERLLERNPGLRGKVKLIQIAVPSRTAISEYAEFRSEVDEVVGRVNGAFATTSWVPVHYLYRSFSQHELVALYRAADAMLVTPLRDGMNLVAKEFAASRPDEQGVLLLSELAGAATELGDALLVNPYDVEGMDDAIVQALRMDPQEQQARMRGLRERVFGWDVHHWVRSFLDDLGAPLHAEPRAPVSPEALVRRVELAITAAPSRALLLDLDGTLLSFTPVPQDAMADEELLALLRRLTALPATEVHLVSGRPAPKLEEWFGALRLGLHGEHGLWSRGLGASRWESNVPVDGSWKPRIHALLEEWRWRTPGSLIEEKSAGLAWHYRKAERDLGRFRAVELIHRLKQEVDELGLDLVDGDKVLEIRQRGVSKALAARRVLAEGTPALVLAMGDDRTDEDLFAALPVGSYAVHVGPRPSQAPIRLASVEEARRFLLRIATALEAKRDQEQLGAMLG